MIILLLVTVTTLSGHDRLGMPEPFQSAAIQPGVQVVEFFRPRYEDRIDSKRNPLELSALTSLITSTFADNSVDALQLDQVESLLPFHPQVRKDRFRATGSLLRRHPPVVNVSTRPLAIIGSLKKSSREQSVKERGCFRLAHRYGNCSIETTPALSSTNVDAALTIHNAGSVSQFFRSHRFQSGIGVGGFSRFKKTLVLAAVD